MRARLVPPSTSIVYYSNVQRRSQPLQYVYHDVRVSAWWQEQCLLGRPIIIIFKTGRNSCDFDGYVYTRTGTYCETSKSETIARSDTISN